MSLIDDVLEPITNAREGSRGKKKIAHHVFSGSTTMIGVCITIIALFKTMEAGKATYADEVLSIANFLFIFSALLSYLSLRKNDDERLENIADILFFLGMILVLVVGFIIVFTDL